MTKFLDLEPGSLLYYLSGPNTTIKAVEVKAVKIISPTSREITYYFISPELLAPIKKGESNHSLEDIPIRKIYVASNSDLAITAFAEPLLFSSNKEALETFLNS